MIIPALAAGMITAVAVAQTQAPQTTDGQVPGVEIHPVGTTRTDPNGGQWFIVNMDFEQRTTLQARLYNPASVPQTVKLYLADMTFDAAGIPEVTNVPTDVGTWGSFEHPSVTIDPQQSVIENFTLTAPRGVDPGDHVGAVVVEQSPQGSGNVRSIKRLAVRLYVTLPGDARKDFEIEKISTRRDSALFTRELTVAVHLKNTGRVRLESTVRVDGAEAKGPQLLMSSATERYVASRKVPLWGGPVRLQVDAQTRSLGLPGPARQMRVTVWVIPWHLFVLLALAAGAVFATRWLLRRRGGKYRAIQTDIRRIERLVAQQMQGPRTSGADVRGPATDPATDPDGAIHAAIKQARRAGDEATAQRLEHALAQRRAPRAGGPPGGMTRAS